MLKTSMVFWMAFFLLTTSCGTVKQTAPLFIMTDKVTPEPKEDTLLKNILNQYPQYFAELLKNNKEWKIQIIYTQINRAANQNPQFTHHYYNITKQYFYPASTVKLPAAALALQKINELKIPGLDKNASFITEAGALNQTAVLNDPTTEDGRPTIANYIKKILLVSGAGHTARCYHTGKTHAYSAYGQ